MDTNTPTSRHPELLTHYEISGSFQTVCDNMLNWIKDEAQLKKEQIISISA